MTTVEARRRGRGLRRRIPRVRGTAIAIALPLLVFLVFAGGWLFHTRTGIVGTNSVGPRFVLRGFAPHQQLCSRGIDLPGNVNVLRLDTGAVRGASTTATLRLYAGGRTQVVHGLLPAGGISAADFRFRPIGHDTVASWCLRAAGTVLGEGGTVAGTSYTGVAYIDGQPIGQVSQMFLHLPGRPELAALPAGARHASVFRAGFVGSWTYWLLPVLVLMCCVAGLRLVLRGIR